jgi:Dolichyl-phosphate-mannose-protein mannosyltransferase
MSEDEIKLDLSFMKRLNYIWVFLILFIVLGVYLRIYHLNFPTIGYHNMKENELLDQAVLFMKEGHWLHKKAFAFYGLDEGLGYHEEYGQMPLVPYMTVVLWFIFGQKIWLIRLLMIAFFLAAVVLSYLITKKLTKNDYVSLLTAFLMTIMPLGIYFGRNIQVEPPALFFSLLSIYFYLRWIEGFSHKDIFYASLFLGIAGLLKYTFMIFAVPMLFIFPFKEFYVRFMKEKTKAVKDILYGVYGMIPLVLGIWIFEFLTIVDPSKKNYDIEPFRVLTTSYWQTRWPIIASFLRDNYTWWFVFMALAGLVFMFLKYRTQLGKFSIGYTIAIIPYILLISSKLAGHSYYQMPFLPLVCILSAYFLFGLGNILKQMFKYKVMLYVPLLVILLAIPEMQAANDRVFGTVFYGQDFLGEYLKTRMEPGERFVAFTGSQDLATCSYAQHSCGWVSNLEEFKHKDEVFNLRYIYIGNSEFDKLNSNDTMWVYIRNNYHIDLVGMLMVNKQFVPLHIILKKGGKFDLTQVQNKQPQPATTYDSKQGPITYYYIQNQ